MCVLISRVCVLLWSYFSTPLWHQNCIPPVKNDVFTVHLQSVGLLPCHSVSVHAGCSISSQYVMLSDVKTQFQICPCRNSCHVTRDVVVPTVGFGGPLVHHVPLQSLLVLKGHGCCLQQGLTPGRLLSHLALSPPKEDSTNVTRGWCSF